MIHWIKKFETGYFEIDEQHKELIALYNQFEKSFRVVMGHEMAIDILQNIQKKLEKHFNFEEEFIQKNMNDKFSEHKFSEHKILHKEALVHFENMKNLFYDGNLDAVENGLKVLEKWILKHTLLESIWLKK